MYFGVFLVILRYFWAFFVIFGVIWYVYGLGHFGVQLVGGACMWHPPTIPFISVAVCFAELRVTSPLSLLGTSLS